MLADLAAALGVSVVRVPAVFLESRPRPLARGTRQQILDRFPRANRRKVVNWLQWCTTTTQYLQAVADQGARYDLDNLVRGIVSTSEAERARAGLAARAERAGMRPARKPVRGASRTTTGDRHAQR